MMRKLQPVQVIQLINKHQTGYELEVYVNYYLQYILLTVSSPGTG